MPYWLKLGPCPPECDKEDLLQAVGKTFGGVISFDVKEKFCRLRILLYIQKPLRHGLFVNLEDGDEVWVPFKYECLPIFCFGCGQMGHGLKDCLSVEEEVKV